MVVGKEVLRDLQRWLSPPDPSTNHNIACGAQRENLDVVVQRHYLPGMGVRRHVAMDSWETYCSYTADLIVPDGFFCSGLGEERPLVRHSIGSSCTEAHILIQICNHPAYRSST